MMIRYHYDKVPSGANTTVNNTTWWGHEMETFSALLAICAGNSPVPGEFPAQRSVTRSFDVFFDLRPNKQLSKQSWGWWFETPSRRLWRHHNGNPGHQQAQNLSSWSRIFWQTQDELSLFCESNCHALHPPLWEWTAEYINIRSCCRPN